MRILRFNPTGLFGYGAHPYVELDGRGVVLFQGPVGSGKSSFFNALCETLFGMSPPRENTRDVTESDIVNKAWKRQAFSAVDLEADGHYYRVGYARNWKDVPVLQGPSRQLDEAGPYAGTSVWFERWDGARWVQQDPRGQDLRYAKMQDTWAKISEVIGMDYDVFCNVSYVAQARALKFIDGANRDREEIVTQIKRLGVYDEGHARAQQQSTTAWQEYRLTAAIASSLRENEEAIHVDGHEYLTLRAQIGKADEKLAQLDLQVEDVQTRVQAVEVVRAAHQQALTAARAEQDQKVQQIQERTAAAGRVQAAITQERSAAAVAISKIETTSADIERANAEVSSRRGVASLEAKRLSAMLPGAGKCPACGSLIDDETLAAHKAEQHRLVAAANASIVTAGEALMVAQSALEQYRRNRQIEIEQERDRRIATLEANLTTSMALVVAAETEKAHLYAKVQQAEQQLGRAGSSDLLQQLTSLQAERTRCATERAQHEAALQQHQRRKDERAEIVARRAAMEVKAAAESLEAKEWAWLAKRYPQIKQLKFASVLQDLNEHLARYLGILTDGRTRVMLSPYRLKKEAQRKQPADRTADDYVFEFDMQVEEPGKLGVPIQLYSGGQRGRITLALIAAFWELAARQGVGTNLLLLDEVINFMDPASIENTVRFVEYLRSRVGTVVIVGHDPTLANLLRRDEMWMCRYDGATTTLEITR